MDRAYFEANYKRVDQDGQPIDLTEAPYLIVRRRDSKVFKMASYVPYGWQARDCIYIEEL